MLRARDILAAIAILWISSTAWNEQSTDNSIAASIRLAFYLRHESNAKILPAVLDVDGDGTPEALAMWTSTTLSTTETSINSKNMTSWKVQVLDLRPMLLPSQTAVTAPLQPKVLLASEAIEGYSMPVAEDVVVPFEPLQMITGQVLTSKVQMNPPKKESLSSTTSIQEERKLHYFCGNDWSDASHKCGTHCPSGQSSDCPNSEKCFADTPCSAAAVENNNANSFSDLLSSMDSLHTTPAGGWPSMFTAWSQGRVTMHSLTAEQTVDTSDAANTTPKQKKKKEGGKPPQLKVILLWDVTPLASLTLANDSENNSTTAPPPLVVAWDNVAVTFVDALSTPTDHGSNAGMLVVTGTVTVYKPKGGDGDDNVEASLKTTEATFVVALDALTGKTLWRSSSSNALDAALLSNNKKEAAVPLPVVESRGRTSVARRRSLFPGLQQRSGTGSSSSSSSSSSSGTATVSCMHEYRRSLLTSGALPYQYWGNEDDTTIAALHFDHQSGGSSHDHHNDGGRKQKTKSNSEPLGKASSRRTEAAPAHGKSKSSWVSSIFSSRKRKKHKTILRYGRPNVIVTHNYEGIQVRALRNGRSLCHLSLQDRTLYADINHDGTLDSLQVITSSSHASLLQNQDDAVMMEERKWVQSLARRVSDLNHKSATVSDQDVLAQKLARTPLCHVLALSGLPTREELFSVNLCAGRGGGGSSSSKKDVSSAAAAAALQQELQGAPLLLVESMGNEFSKGHDLVAAVNTGTVTRFRGTNGRRLWQVDEKRYHSSIYPTWDDPSIVAFGRIDSENVVPSTRPIILAGQNSVALLAASSGRLLASASFPQPSQTRPRLVDLNGDGTTDLLVSTKDAVWGYHVVVRTGTSVPFRMMVGLLAMGLMLAFLRNRFGPHPGKRSTDL